MASTWFLETSASGRESLQSQAVFSRKQLLAVEVLAELKVSKGHPARLAEKFMQKVAAARARATFAPKVILWLSRGGIEAEQG